MSDDERYSNCDESDPGLIANYYGMRARDPWEMRDRSRPHEWVEPDDLIKWVHCKRCFIIRNKDDRHGPCRGPAKLVMRES